MHEGCEMRYPLDYRLECSCLTSQPNNSVLCQVSGYTSGFEDIVHSVSFFQCLLPPPFLIRSYKRPRSAGPRLQNRHPKQDYSTVEAKVDTGRGSHSKEAERKVAHGAGGVVSHRRRATTDSHEVCDARAIHDCMHN